MTMTKLNSTKNIANRQVLPLERLKTLDALADTGFPKEQSPKSIKRVTVLIAIPPIQKKKSE